MFYLNDAFKGYFTIYDLLQSELTIQFGVDSFVINSNGTLFEIGNDEFKLKLEIVDQKITLSRNIDRVTLNLSDYEHSEDLLNIFLILSPNQICLIMKIHQPIILNEKIETIPTYPDIALIQEARKKNFIPVISYPTEEDFRDRVHQSLLQINKKIQEADAYISYWNIQYNGQKIVARTPKKEVEVQPLIQQLIADTMLLGSIEITPEAPTGSGNVDFIFSAHVENKGLKKICGEVKLAHSRDLKNGMTVQLPQYMNATNAKYGIYIVPSYRGKWFSEPTFSNKEDIEFNLNLEKKNIKGVNPDNIRSIIINMAKPNTASKK